MYVLAIEKALQYTLINIALSTGHITTLFDRILTKMLSRFPVTNDSFVTYEKHTNCNVKLPHEDTEKLLFISLFTQHKNYKIQQLIK